MENNDLTWCLNPLLCKRLLDGTSLVQAQAGISSNWYRESGEVRMASPRHMSSHSVSMLTPHSSYCCVRGYPTPWCKYWWASEQLLVIGEYGFTASGALLLWVTLVTCIVYGKDGSITLCAIPLWGPYSICVNTKTIHLGRSKERKTGFQKSF